MDRVEAPQSIMMCRNTDDSGDVLRTYVQDKITINCYEKYKSFNSWVENGRLLTDLEEFVGLLKARFSLKEFNRNIVCAIDSLKWTGMISLADDYSYIFVQSIGKVDKIRSLEDVEQSNDSDKSSWDYSVTLHFGGCDERCNEFVEFFKQYIARINQDNRGVYCMINGSMGLDLYHMGFPGKSIIPTNYSGASIASFNRIVNDLRSDSPYGCLSILSGPPGSGKTYLVRAVIEAADKDALFVIVPPSIIAQISGPDLIPMLIKIKQNYLDRKRCCVFILEDCDSILIPRGEDNMSSISSLLNLADGIIGSMFSIRILATTNANHLEFDQALVRPGRLSCRAEIGELNRDESIVCYNALTKTVDGRKYITKSMTLAEVYALAVGNDYVFEVPEKHLGFKPEVAQQVMTKPSRAIGLNIDPPLR